MLDRASTFADPEIVRLLRTRFVPVAIDQFYQRQQKDAEGEFYRQIAIRGARRDENGTTQGLYVATADGKLLAFNNNRGPERIKRLLEKSLRDYQPTAVPELEQRAADPRFERVPPKGGLVVRVNAKVLGGYQETEDQWRKIFQSALSRDNLWIREDEHQALVRGELTESLKRRIARFHLVDNTRGEPPMWNPEDLREIDLKLEGGELTGSVWLETPSGDRGYQADLFGFVETQNGRVTRLDLVSKGMFWGEGPYTRGAPKGKFPLAVAFSLAKGDEEADRVPPQGSKGWLPGYIR
ncbi:MAG: hypothetical protein AB7I30_00345 [Isosphaeraceae bacterium]